MFSREEHDLDVYARKAALDVFIEDSKIDLPLADRLMTWAGGVNDEDDEQRITMWEVDDTMILVLQYGHDEIEHRVFMEVMN